MTNLNNVITDSVFYNAVSRESFLTRRRESDIKYSVGDLVRVCVIFDNDVNFRDDVACLLFIKKIHKRKTRIQYFEGKIVGFKYYNKEEINPNISISKTIYDTQQSQFKDGIKSVHCGWILLGKKVKRLFYDSFFFTEEKVILT